LLTRVIQVVSSRKCYTSYSVVVVVVVVVVVGSTPYIADIRKVRWSTGLEDDEAWTGWVASFGRWYGDPALDRGT
jgi:hypothetical protein